MNKEASIENLVISTATKISLLGERIINRRAIIQEENSTITR
jgi:hypothetical protein